MNMRWGVGALLGCLAMVACASTPPERSAPLTTEIRFDSQGLVLSGLLDTPASDQAEGLVILVHGYGATNVVEQNWYADLRTRFAAQGVSSFVWDKPGCGASQGEFDANQSVESSAEEVLDAAAHLRALGVPGAQKIGLWGVSRAGWIAPLALAQDRELAFWMSVSGVDAKESFGYLLRANWALEGYPADKIDRLYGQWITGNQMVRDGVPLPDYLAATEDLRTDPFYLYMSGGEIAVDADAYASAIDQAQRLSQPIDPETGLPIYVEDFEGLLAGLDLPVLALFGAKDTSVDWQATRALYARTIGVNPKADLEIVVFPDGNHNLHQAETGSFKEMLDILNAPSMVPGYYETVLEWLSATLAK